MEIQDSEDQRVKLELQAEMDYQASQEPPGLPVMLATEHLERKDSLVSLVLKVVLGVLENLGLDLLEHPGSEASLENLAYLVSRDHLVYLAREAKCFLVPYLVKMETRVCRACLADQVIKASQVSLEVLDVLGLMELKEREESLGLEASLDLKVSLESEGSLAFQVSLEEVLTEAAGRTASLGVLEPKASLERCLEPRQELRGGTVYLAPQETRASPDPQGVLGPPVLMDVLAFLG